MNEQGILHMPDSKYCFPLDTHTLVLRLRVDRKDRVEKAEVIYESKYEIYGRQQTLLMERKYEDRLYAYYEAVLSLKDVRLAYVFRIWEDNKGYYFSEDGLSETYNFALGYYNFFQLPYINAVDVHEEAAWMRSAVFYEIFVDRFCSGTDIAQKKHITLKWGDKPKPKGLAGGDLKGIMSKLDYLKELGVNALYLTPIFCSISNHKYDISDYYNIDAQFGTNADFKMLVDEAHKKGIRIVLDAVFNHCSELLPQFQDVLKHGKKSPYFDWFLIDGDSPDGDALNYEVFAFCSYMPKLNTSNSSVQEFLADIAVYWIEQYDIDGWRLDVSDEISHDFWRMFRKKVRAAKKDCVIIGENWHDANSFLQGEQYDGIMNYAFTKACLDYYAFEVFGAQDFAWKLNQLLMRNTMQVNNMMLNLLDSHDTDRFYTSVKKNKDKVLSAIAVMCMFVGAPCIYYGTEIPLEGGYDPDNRRCFDWDSTHWDKTYRELLQRLLGLRGEKEIQKGDVRSWAQKDLFLLSRVSEENEIVLMVNQSGKSLDVEFEGTVMIKNHFESKTVNQSELWGSLLSGGFMVIRGHSDTIQLKERNMETLMIENEEK